MDVEDIVMLLRLCLDTTYFQVNGAFYKQKRGTAMGSPVSVVVANLFMEELEQRALESFAHPVKVWRCYVDDTFVVMKGDLVDSFHEHLNSQAAGVAFTVEREKEAFFHFWT